MKEDLNWLLTDEFVTFSNKIKEIVDLKKAKKAEMKSFYEKIQNDLKKLDEDANLAREEFETFKSTYKKEE